MARYTSRGENTTTTGEEITASSTTMVEVHAGIASEDVLNWDAEGKGLLFDAKKGFKQLTDVELASLSAANKKRYNDAFAFHKTWRDSDDQVMASIVDVDLQLTSSPGEKLRVKHVPDGMEYRWARPEKVRTMQAKGWQFADASTETFIGATGNVHRIGVNGATELVLMLKSKSKVLADRKKRADENNRRAGALPSVVDGEARAVGMSNYVPESDKKKRLWKEVDTLGGSPGEE